MPIFGEKNVLFAKNTLYYRQKKSMGKNIYLFTTIISTSHAHIVWKKRQIIQKYTIIWTKKVDVKSIIYFFATIISTS